jgi:hypothetical protein
VLFRRKIERALHRDRGRAAGFGFLASAYWKPIETWSGPLEHNSWFCLGMQETWPGLLKLRVCDAVGRMREEAE